MSDDSDDDDDGKRRRDQGMTKALDAQERKKKWLKKKALAALRYVAERNKYLHADMVRARLGVSLEHPNAWGPIWMHAIQQGWIKLALNVPPVRSKRPEAHSSKMAVYVSCLYPDDEVPVA